MPALSDLAMPRASTPCHAPVPPNLDAPIRACLAVLHQTRRNLVSSHRAVRSYACRVSPQAVIRRLSWITPRLP